ncbi:MAG: hypothetical protein WKG07_16625 [Hymenobacter sp.]
MEVGFAAGCRLFAGCPLVVRTSGAPDERTAGPKAGNPPRVPPTCTFVNASLSRNFGGTLTSLLVPEKTVSWAP